MKIIIIPVLMMICLGLLHSEDKIPNAVGEIFMQQKSKKKWTFKALSPKSRVECRNSVPGDLQFYCYDKNATGYFTASLKFDDLICEKFDTFVFNCLASNKLNIRVSLKTDAGERASDWIKINKIRRIRLAKVEVPVNLDGAKKIESFCVEIKLKAPGRNNGNIFVCPVFLRNKNDYEAYKRYWDYYADLKWEGLIKPESYNPSYKLQCQLLFNQKDLESYRQKYAKKIKRYIPIIQKQSCPEKAISPSPLVSFSPGLVLQRYNKVFKDKGSSPMQDNGIAAACLGIVCKDKKLMRLAARYLLACATQADWNDSFWQRRVGGIGGPAFWPAKQTRKMVFIFDCVGEYLTKQGRNYVLKEIAYKGFAPLTQSLWHYAPFGLNQGMVFLNGKLYALALFDKYWKRVKPYINICKAEADESMNMLFCSDGGYVESTGYFDYAMMQAVDFYGTYSNMSGKEISNFLPENIKASNAFADVIISTMKKKGRTIVSFGHSYNWNNFHPLVVAFMATAIPDSSWGILYRKLDKATKDKALANYSMGSGITFLGLDRQAARNKAGKLKPFVLLKSVGLTASNRQGKDGMTKIAVFGTQKKCLKRDYDIGQFILEFAGDSFAMSTPVRGGLHASSQFRNLLVPIKKDNSFANQIYYYRVKNRNRFCPQATGDEKRFTSSIDLSGTWEKQYLKKHVRLIDSPNPNLVTITDDYEVGTDSKGVAFMLQTYLPAEIMGNDVVITGEYGGIAKISFPDYCKVEIEKISLPKKILKGMTLNANHKCSRIIIRNQKLKDKMKISINLSVANAQDTK